MRQVTDAATKARVRADYLMDKYAGRWKTNMWKVPAVTLKLTQTTWLQVRQKNVIVLFVFLLLQLEGGVFFLFILSLSEICNLFIRF